eukprot:TRINITY_DN21377_c0_g1_i2.p1 TRINITY_DN21377_c0_g1~~TRINITY_DN21377_c0_g1_i2.p1  ORF type:complete len:366 (-),score=63.73 TRINITY_DN21377_c0_g1_i2:117-1214(-)
MAASDIENPSARLLVAEEPDGQSTPAGTSLWDTMKGYFAALLKLPAVELGMLLASMLLPVCDLLTDTFIALPAYLQHDMQESFQVQVLGMCVASTLAYVNTMLNYDAWDKLGQLPCWLRALLLTGGAFIWLLAPFFVIGEALVVWLNSIDTLKQETKDGAHLAAAGEFAEGLLSNAIQSRAYFISGINVQTSVLVGWLSAAKAALHFDVKDHVVQRMAMVSPAGDRAKAVPLVFGPMQDLAAHPLHTVLLAAHRLLEVGSGTSCAILVHVGAYGFASHRVGSHTVSIAGPCYYAGQILLLVVISCIQGKAINMFNALLMPVCVPKPLFDAATPIGVEFLIRGMAQVNDLRPLADSSNLRRHPELI